MGIEPTPSAWKAEVLPLNYARTTIYKQTSLHHFATLNTRCIKDWRGQDSNLRRRSRQIYSLIPLTAREPLRAKQARHCHQVLIACQEKTRSKQGLIANPWSRVKSSSTLLPPKPHLALPEKTFQR